MSKRGTHQNAKDRARELASSVEHPTQFSPPGHGSFLTGIFHTQPTYPFVSILPVLGQPIDNYDRVRSPQNHPSREQASRLVNAAVYHAGRPFIWKGPSLSLSMIAAQCARGTHILESWTHLGARACLPIHGRQRE